MTSGDDSLSSQGDIELNNCTYDVNLENNVPAPVGAPNELSPPNSGTLHNVMYPVQIVSYLVFYVFSLISNMFNHQILPHGDHNNSYVPGISEEEQKTVYETVPSIQRELKKDMNAVSTDQKIVNDQIEDLKERIRKIEERRHKRALYLQKCRETKSSGVS